MVCELVLEKTLFNADLYPVFKRLIKRTSVFILAKSYIAAMGNKN